MNEKCFPLGKLVGTISLQNRLNEQQMRLMSQITEEPILQNPSHL